MENWFHAEFAQPQVLLFGEEPGVGDQNQVRQAARFLDGADDLLDVLPQQRFAAGQLDGQRVELGAQPGIIGRGQVPQRPGLDARPCRNACSRPCKSGSTQTKRPGGDRSRNSTCLARSFWRRERMVSRAQGLLCSGRIWKTRDDRIKNLAPVRKARWLPLRGSPKILPRMGGRKSICCRWRPADSLITLTLMAGRTPPHSRSTAKTDISGLRNHHSVHSGSLLGCRGLC